MDPETTALLRELADRSPSERDAYYARHAVPAARRSEVESLLGFDDGVGDSLDDLVAAARLALAFDATEARTIGSAATTVGSLGLPRPTQETSEGRFPPGTLVAGRYRIVTMVGRGGMGEVYRADDLTLRQPVALKFLPERLGAAPPFVDRLHAEVRLARQISHPNVCRVYDIGTAADTAFISMQYIDGEDLASLLRRIGELPRPKAIEIARCLCAGLAAAHDKGVVHRDLKPSNIMIDGRGQVLITDFGLAASSRDGEPVRGASGTPAYMAPEQLLGLGASFQSDLYSLGLVLCEMFTGSRPSVHERTVDERAAGLRRMAADVDPMIVRAIACCLEADPGRRPASALEVADMLPGGTPRADALAAGITPSPHVVAASRETTATWVRAIVGRLVRHGRRKPAVMATALAAAVVVGGVLFGPRPWPLPTTISGGPPEPAVPTRESAPQQTDARIPPTHTRQPQETAVQPQRQADLPGAVSAHVLTDRDVLVLADITNTTGDPVFDRTLREALAYELEQSRFLKIVGDEQMRRTLGLMGRSPDEGITNQIARQICVRLGEKVFIGGSIASFGTTYALSLQAVHCETGDPLAREQAQAADKDRVLQAVSQAARGMRAKLGESLSSIQKPDRNLTQVTTTSLAAFQAYALGLTPVRQGTWLAAIPFFRRATELDPNFAMAWLRLGQMYGNSGDRTAMLANYSKAFALRDRVTEREELPITTAYYGVTGESDKAAEIYRMWVRTYTRDAYPHYRLGQNHRLRGRFEEALREYEEAVRLEPRAIYYAELLDTHGLLGRFDDVKAVADRASSAGLDSPDIHLSLLRIAFARDDRAAAQSEARWFVDKPEEYASLSLQAQNLYVLGQRRKSYELQQRAFELRRRQNLGGAVPPRQSVTEPLFGECDAAKRPSSLVAMAHCGDAAAAQQLVDQLMATDVNVNAQVTYLRGLAYLGQRNAVAAATEFQNLLDHRSLNWGPYYPLSFLGLARAALMDGDVTRARKAYQDFFAVWKDADPDIPILIEAKKDYDALN